MSAVIGNVWLEARKTFLPFQGVVGVGYGPKLKKNKILTRHAVIVLVEKKLPRREVPSEEVIPSVFRGLPTDVREPRLMLAVDEGEEPTKLPEDFCLTDHQWIDAGKIHRMRLEQQRSPGSDDLI